MDSCGKSLVGDFWYLDISLDVELTTINNLGVHMTLDKYQMILEYLQCLNDYAVTMMMVTLHWSTYNASMTMLQQQ